MSWRVHDRWLWLGLGAFTILAVRGVSHALKDILHLTEIHEQPRSKHVCTVSQDTEDAIQAGSLNVLTKSHNLDIRNAAIRIICDRFLSSPSNITSLTRDIYSGNPDRRQQARSALKLLERYASPDSYTAVIFLEPIPIPSEGDLDKFQNFVEGMLQSEMTTAEIAQLEQLQRSGQIQRPEQSQLPRLREREESIEEQALRRRRREAVVINEGNRPLTQQDIIQRNTPGSVAPRDEIERRRVERALEAISANGHTDVGMRGALRLTPTLMRDEEQSRDG